MKMSERRFFILLFLLAAIVPIGRGDLIPEPYFAAPIMNVTVAVGRQATFACTVHNLSNFKVAWLRVDTQTILTIHNHVMTKSPRVSMTYGDRTWYLHIRNVREKDQGWYMCQINTDPMKSQLGYLYVVVPPDILDAGTTSDKRVREGDSVHLQCNAVGQPTPSVTWKRENGQTILINNGSQVHSVSGPILRLERVTREHMGSYLCIATNGVPPTMSKRVMLVVEFPPVIWIQNQLVGAKFGANDVVLECIIEAYPKSINYWTRENGEIVPQGGDKEPQKTENEYKVVMRLLKRKMKEEDFGTYKCISKNALGETEGTIKVYEITNLVKEESKNTKMQNEVGNEKDKLKADGEDGFIADYEDDPPSSSSSTNVFFPLLFLHFIIRLSWR